jgi:hypothetical protein
MVRWRVVYSSFVAASLLAVAACGSDSTTSSNTGADGGSDAATPKTTCGGSCKADEVCAEPGACLMDAKCIKRADITCPDSGAACSSQAGCAGQWGNDGGTFHCICR